MTISSVKRNGVVYTPDSVVKRIVENTLPFSPHLLENAKICDPACGNGAFLSTAAKLIVDKLPRKKAFRSLAKIAGYDSDGKILASCAERLQSILEAKYPGAKIDWNLQQKNALDREKYSSEFGQFSHILGNPPYVRIQHLGAGRRKHIKGNWKVQYGATDLFAVFFELGINLLRPGGRLGFITPSSWLHSNAGKMLRQFFSEKTKILKILDYGHHQVFDKITAYTAITIIEKIIAKPASFPYWRHDGTRFRNAGKIIIPVKFPETPWIPSTRHVRNRILKLEKRGPRLDEIAKINVGIQTLADKVFILNISDDRKTYNNFISCIYNNKKFLLERWILRPILKASVMREGQDVVDRVIVYPYDKDGMLLPYEYIAAKAPLALKWLTTNREHLLARDKGSFDKIRWYAFGRNVSITSGFGDKIITSGINLKPNFQRCLNPDATFYSGYCVKPQAGIDIGKLLRSLNSADMEFHIKHTSRPFQSGWMSYAKSYIRNFRIPSCVLK